MQFHRKPSCRCYRNQRAVRAEYASNAEKMCGIKKSDRILPVYTLCLYHGEDAWDGPRTLKDMMDFGDDADGMSEYFVDYPYHLCCLNEIEDYSVFSTEIRLLFTILRYRKDKVGLKRLLEGNAEYRRMDADTLEVVATMLNAPRIWEDRMKYMSVEEEKEEYNMYQALREWIEEERESGILEGKNVGREESIRNLMETMKWTAEQAMSALKIPDDERANYLERL